VEEAVDLATSSVSEDKRVLSTFPIPNYGRRLMEAQFKVRTFDEIIEWLGEARWSRMLGEDCW